MHAYPSNTYKTCLWPEVVTPHNNIGNVVVVGGFKDVMMLRNVVGVNKCGGG